MHKAICDECGQSCEVPFKPSGDKPIYCSNCFKGKENSSGGRSSGRDFGKDNFREKRMFSAVCDACGQNCEVPFRPTSGKPVYCSKCFDQMGGGSDRGSDRGRGGNNKSNDKLGEQIAALNSKLDKILEHLLPKPITKIRFQQKLR
jgi:CxxC-x17-CxxC domain-containing protein